jgi:beta-lactamase superfamily II metal-dependent hydrolase
VRRRKPPSAAEPIRVHFLDVGAEEYGDAVLCEFAGTTVLIDGAHPGNQVSAPGHRSIPEQLEALLQTTRPVQVDLLVVTHAHSDHIGCLPAMVKDGTLRARWALVPDPALGWGRTADGGDVAAPPVDPVVAAMREEVPSEQADDRVLAQLLIDAAGLEQRYTEMLSTLADQGTRVVRQGNDPLDALLQEFAPIGLKVLGPSDAQLHLCADEIARTTQDALDRLSDLRATTDAPESSVEQYRRLLRPSADLIDASDRPGPAINLQSIVTVFSLNDVKLLFAGDMQLADPQIGGDALANEVADLRAQIRAEAPYEVVKLCHHGSDNGLDAGVLADFSTTPVYGVCAGEDSKSHPNPTVLRLLVGAGDRVKWVRTDRNGRSTIELVDDQPRFDLERGNLSDPRPNTEDVAVVAAVTEPTARTESGDGSIEVVTRVPRGARVSLTVDASEAPGEPAQATTGAADRLGPVRVAGGRDLPRLLFTTSAEQLATNVGAVEAERALDAVRSNRSVLLYDELPAGVPADQARAAVTEQIRRDGKVKGVVLLGGLDVVPSHRRDALPPRLRQQLGRTEDPDDFIVWSDEAYGDLDGDAIAEVPVSRIPDGRSPELLFAALGASNRRRRGVRQGVRNRARPFAEDVYRLLPGDRALLVSDPTAPPAVGPLRADLVYVMLHGDFGDTSRFWGEDELGQAFEAVNVTNVPAAGGRVVFAGCCWGALTVDQPALRAHPDAPPGPKPVGSSMALSFLLGGATAFVGSTGVHYSPPPPGDYFGGPMHKEFIKSLLTGHPPAEALFEAKRAYGANMPHGQGRPMDLAIEFKILNEFTCLGLGW